MKIINKDITTIETGIIGHQCNCMGVMGAGVAKAIKNKWPKAYDDYKSAFKHNKLVLGAVIISDIVLNGDNPLFIAHLCGQYNYYGKSVLTNYDALSKALSTIKLFQHKYKSIYNKELQVYLPYGIGCGLARGDWKIVKSILEDIVPDIILCKLGA